MEFKDLIGKRVLLKHWIKDIEPQTYIPIDAWSSGYGDEFVMLLDLSNGAINSSWVTDWDILSSEADIASKAMLELINSYRALRLEIETKEEKMFDILENIRNIELK